MRDSRHGADLIPRAAEIALDPIAILIASGLLLTSFSRLQQVEPGFQPEGVFTAQLVLPLAALFTMMGMMAVRGEGLDAASGGVSRAERDRE